MENRVTIDWAAHEADMARMERVNRRLWIALIVAIAFFTITNAAWIVYENSFIDEVTVTQESDAKDGGAAIVNNGGDVNYGESTANSH